jgi:hypothetical protein
LEDAFGRARRETLSKAAASFGVEERLLEAAARALSVRLAAVTGSR